MKKILKKNQIIVTALAVLIAVAGYLNYTDNLSKKEKTKEANNNTYDSVYSQDNLSDENGEIKSLDGEGLDSSAENSGNDVNGVFDLFLYAGQTVCIIHDSFFIVSRTGPDDEKESRIFPRKDIFDFFVAPALCFINSRFDRIIFFQFLRRWQFPDELHFQFHILYPPKLNGTFNYITEGNRSSSIFHSFSAHYGLNL